MQERYDNEFGDISQWLLAGMHPAHWRTDEVVIPAELRRRYDLRPGAQVMLVDYGGVLAIVPAISNPVEESAGMLRGGSSLPKHYWKNEPGRKRVKAELSCYILDSFALLAYLESEPGGSQVKTVLVQAEHEQAEVYLSVVNYGELFISPNGRRD